MTATRWRSIAREQWRRGARLAAADREPRGPRYRPRRAVRLVAARSTGPVPQMDRLMPGPAQAPRLYLLCRPDHRLASGSLARVARRPRSALRHLPGSADRTRVCASWRSHGMGDARTASRVACRRAHSQRGSTIARRIATACSMISGRSLPVCDLRHGPSVFADPDRRRPCPRGALRVACKGWAWPVPVSRAYAAAQAASWPRRPLQTVPQAHEVEQPVVVAGELPVERPEG